MNNNKLQSLITERNNIQEEINNIEQEEQNKLSLSFIGKYYKYRNSYSCPEEESDYWYLYIKVLSIAELYSGNSTFKCFIFQQDKYGKIEIELENKNHYRSMIEGSIEITKEEFIEEWRNIQDTVSYGAEKLL